VPGRAQRAAGTPSTEAPGARAGGTRRRHPGADRDRAHGAQSAGAWRFAHDASAVAARRATGADCAWVFGHPTPWARLHPMGRDGTDPDAALEPAACSAAADAVRTGRAIADGGLLAVPLADGGAGALVVALGGTLARDAAIVGALRTVARCVVATPA
jgi:hypothetical protein